MLADITELPLTVKLPIGFSAPTAPLKVVNEFTVVVVNELGSI